MHEGDSVIDSRAKGRTAERAVELEFQGAGLSTERALSGRTQVHGDILSEGLAVEVRNRQRIEIVKWSAEHELGCPNHLTPVVVYRCNHQPWRASLLLSDLLDLVKEARS